MATRFAVATGNWSNTAIWDNGVLPTSSDDIYANNFTVTIDGTFTVLSIRNTISPVFVPNIATPIMTSNTTPSGTAFASSNNSSAWNAFAQDGSTTQWGSAVANTGILGYQFTSGKVIKRYVIKGSSTSNQNPSTWTFQGSNDGTTYTTLETVTSSTIPSGGNYTSGILANTTSYTYYRINITAVGAGGNFPTITEFEMTESTGTVLGNATGGQFIFANGGNLTCTATQAIYVGAASTPVLDMTLSTPNTATFTGDVKTIADVTNNIAIRLSGTGTLNLNGNYQNIISANTVTIISLNSTGTINIVGDLTNVNTDTGAGIGATLRSAASGGIINITGNITGGASTSILKSTVYVPFTITINITGNINGATGFGIGVASAATINVIGNVTAGSNPSIFNITTACTIAVTGTTTASTTAPAIYSSFALTSGYASGTYVKISGNVVNSTNNMAVVAPRVTIDSNTSSWLFQISTGGNRTLYAAGVPLGNPATSNVRFGTVYGASSELTGTMRVPSSINVLQGVNVDNTVGTLLMTPAQCWNYLISSGFVANSIGDRLQNASTVSTTGAQIASYNI